MIEEPNKLVFEKAIRSVELISRLKDKYFIQRKATAFMKILFKKSKDTKSQVVRIVKNTLCVLILTETVSVDSVFETGLTLASESSSHPRIKSFSCEFLSDLLELQEGSPSKPGQVREESELETRMEAACKCRHEALNPRF